MHNQPDPGWRAGLECLRGPVPGLLAGLLASILLLPACADPPPLEVSPGAVDFGVVDVGGLGLAHVWISNGGDRRTVQLAIDPPGTAFQLVGPDEISLAAQDEIAVELRAGSSLAGPATATLRVTAPGAQHSVSLTAEFASAVTDLDGDGHPAQTDCDDLDPDVYPGAPELCDGLDDDCDGAVPADEVDEDGDLHLACGGDCDDEDPLTHPGAAELCDQRDDDCDGAVDEPFDVDLDGFYDALVPDCQLAWMAHQLDCDDTDPTRHPGAEEVCNGLDDDCDGVLLIEEIDSDGDGVPTCMGDCNDSVAAIHPGAAELCDRLDDDCDGQVPADEQDGDGDGVATCEGDCDDTDPDLSPLAAELCNGLDDDCDGQVGAIELDADGDTWAGCDGDCDDADPLIHPAAAEVCDGLDTDCDGAPGPGESDDDGDGFAACAGDCDDAQAAVYPGASEVCDGLDDDCDGVVPGGEEDLDADGWMPCDGDCDDTSFPVNPGVAEDRCDDLDNDCDGVIEAGGAVQEFVVKGNNTNHGQVWQSNFAGGFSSLSAWFPMGSGTVYGTVAADFDADGYLDFVLVQSFNWPVTVQGHLFKSTCDGGFEATPLTAEAGGDGLVLDGLQADLHTGADVDGDGDVDLIGWDFWDGSGYVWLNGGDGVQWTRIPEEGDTTHPFELGYWQPWADLESVATPPVDVTGDGLPDLVECATQDAGLTDCLVHEGVGDGTFVVASSFGLDQTVNGFALQDFDGDGEVDLLGGFDDDGDAGQGWLWSGAVAPGYASGPGVPVLDVNPSVESGGVDEAGLGWPYPHDLDDDGDVDLVLSVMLASGGIDRELVVALNDGSGAFAAPVAFATTVHALDGRYAWVQDQVAVPIWPDAQ